MFNTYMDTKHEFVMHKKMNQDLLQEQGNQTNQINRLNQIIVYNSQKQAGEEYQKQTIAVTYLAIM